MTTIASDTTVGRLATEHPLSTRIFARHGIDFCCGGGSTLIEACQKRGLDPAAIAEEIARELAAGGASDRRWDTAPLGELIDHILAVYHRSHWEELPALEAMARKVHNVHKEKEPAMLAELVSVYQSLRTELEGHMMKEEQVLFPMIKLGRGQFAGGPISVMERDHDVAGALLARLRELTGGYRVHEEACTTWRALWHRLEALERDVHEHIHLENNILFPRALAGA